MNRLEIAVAIMTAPKGVWDHVDTWEGALGCADRAIAAELATRPKEDAAMAELRRVVSALEGVVTPDILLEAARKVVGG